MLLPLPPAPCPFHPLLPSLFLCSRPALRWGPPFLQKAMCSGAGFHLQMPFLCLECFSSPSVLRILNLEDSADLHPCKTFPFSLLFSDTFFVV